MFISVPFIFPLHGLVQTSLRWLVLVKYWCSAIEIYTDTVKRKTLSVARVVSLNPFFYIFECINIFLGIFVPAYREKRYSFDLLTVTKCLENIHKNSHSNLNGFNEFIIWSTVLKLASQWCDVLKNSLNFSVSHNSS